MMYASAEVVENVPVIPSEEVAIRSYPPFVFPTNNLPLVGAVVVPVPPFGIESAFERLSVPMVDEPSTANVVVVALVVEAFVAKSEVKLL
jgi:hypothetical protein